ncbi:MAG: metallophosphoesterase [SAR324 cluster bacterium]|nr:metallophosphoesterase [SAR324 cluster bacterium]
MSDSLILVHISDPHFHRLPRHPRQWFSKRGLGALNLLLRRARLHPRERAVRLVRQLERMDWDHLVISGDMTQLALEEEFELARRMLEPLLARGKDRVTILPGNHDRYVAEPGGRDIFRAYFEEFFGEGEIATRKLSQTWRLAAWDSALPTPLFQATGRVRRETLDATERWLGGLPEGARVVLANHYPLYFLPPHGGRRSHGLENLEEVRRWLTGRGIELYLHGHLHENWVLRLTDAGRPQIHVNSASSTRVPRKGHNSAFHRIVLSGDAPEIQPLALD